jgi:hypothetical protein
MLEETRRFPPGWKVVPCKKREGHWYIYDGAGRCVAYQECGEYGAECTAWRHFGMTRLKFEAMERAHKERLALKFPPKQDRVLAALAGEG